jgi:hypothetical protein
MFVDDVRTLAAKQEITEALHRYARAVDRLDRDLMESLWHEGATVAYDNLFKGTAIDSIEWIWRAHEDKTKRSVHCVTNVLIEVNGDTAASECYMFTTLRDQVGGKLVDFMSWGRYVDHWSYRDDRWRIDRRVYVTDITNIVDIADSPRATTDVSATASRMDRTDPSYAAMTV